jgi:hypothetical protein
VPARLTADVREPAAGIDRVPAHRERVDGAIGARIPRRGRTGRDVERGDLAAQAAADLAEEAAGVERAADAHERLHRAVRRRIPRGHGAVREDVREVRARLAAHRGEVAADEPAAGAVGERARHVTDDDRETRGGRTASSVEGHAAPGHRTDAREVAADVERVPVEDGGAHHAVRDPEVAAQGLRAGGAGKNREGERGVQQTSRVGVLELAWSHGVSPSDGTSERPAQRTTRYGLHGPGGIR